MTNILWIGVKGFAVKEELKRIAIEEMIHLEKIADRLAVLGDKPPIEHFEVKVGENLFEMLKNDAEAEIKTIELYKKIIKLAENLGDYTTALLFKEILSDEEDH